MKKFCSFCNKNLIDVKEKCCNSCKEKLSQRHKIYKKYRKDTIEQKFYSSDDWIKTREKIKEIDNNLCILCLDNKELNNMATVHHIEELKDNWNLRFEKDNLISLCESCHQKIHKKYLVDKTNTQNKLKILIKRYRE